MKKYLILIIFCLNACSLFGDKEEGNVISEAVQIPESEIIQNAERAYQNGMLKLSRKHWQELKEIYPTSYYSPLADIKIADSYYLNKEYGDALTSYEAFLRLYPEHEAAPYALFQIANTHINKYRASSLDQLPLRTAIESLERLQKDYPNSAYTQKAESLIEKCNEGLAKHEVVVIKFYTRQKDYTSAINRINYLKKTYPKSLATKNLMQTLEEDLPEEFLELQEKIKNS